MIRGILFDKDGTLIDFFSLWLKAALKVVPEFLRENQIEDSPEMIDYILEVIGVEGQTVNPEGALAYKSYGEMAEEIRKALEKRGYILETIKIHIQIEILFQESVTGENASFKQLGDIRSIAEELKKRHIYMGLATADTISSAEDCLKSMNIFHLFDYIGADDGEKRPKPEKDMFLEFQQNFGLKAEEIAVVGDTCNDMQFARNGGGIGIGVLSGVSTENDFQGKTDYVIESIQQLPDLLDRM
ncbi:MAG: HAD family hydrolase [Muricomes sp.]